MDVAVGWGGHHIGDRSRDGFGPEEVCGVVVAAFELDKFTLHVSVGTPRIYRGHSQFGLVVAQRVRERA